MLSFCLIGKNIAHSRSPIIYKNILKQNIIYDLIDCYREDDIPSLEELFKKYNGVSITTPYKRYFLSKVKISNDIKKLEAINCIGKLNNSYKAINTDYLAVRHILEKYLKNYGSLNVLILGGGVMSSITQKILKDMNVYFSIITRKEYPNMEKIDLSTFFNNKIGQKIVINSCSRQYVFSGKAPNNTIFWDYNYNFIPHQQTMSVIFSKYIDGMELLTLQARYALEFWNVI